MENNFGKFFAELRRNKTKLGLREFCEKYNYDPGNISRLERGKMSPPTSDAKLEEYAAALGIERDSKEWYEFFDRASTDRGKLPTDLLNDREIIENLPLLFRGLRNRGLNSEKFKELLRAIGDS